MCLWKPPSVEPVVEVEEGASVWGLEHAEGVWDSSPKNGRLHNESEAERFATNLQD